MDTFLQICCKFLAKFPTLLFKPSPSSAHPLATAAAACDVRGLSPWLPLARPAYSEGPREAVWGANPIPQCAARCVGGDGSSRSESNKIDKQHERITWLSGRRHPARSAQPPPPGLPFAPFAAPASAPPHRLFVHFPPAPSHPSCNQPHRLRDGWCAFCTPIAAASHIAPTTAGGVTERPEAPQMKGTWKLRNAAAWPRPGLPATPKGLGVGDALLAESARRVRTDGRQLGALSEPQWLEISHHLIHSRSSDLRPTGGERTG